MIRLGILGSTRGTHLLPVIEAIEKKHLDASIQVVISNKAEAMILSRAKHHGLQTAYLPRENLSREAYDQRMSELLFAHKVDLVVLIGFMRILSSEFVQQWSNQIINVHPSLLPAFAGKMDLDVHQSVLEAGVSETGCTVHYVTAVVDGGPVLVQKTCPVLSDDTVDALKQRVQGLESQALIEAIHFLSLEDR